MKKKLLLALSGMVMSFSALAGGGGAAWKPSVSPQQCIKNYPSPQETLQWNNISECDEVIRNGYAVSVLVSGLFVYEGGETVRFSGAANPYRADKLDAPRALNGKKYKGIANSSYQWVR